MKKQTAKKATSSKDLDTRKNPVGGKPSKWSR
jgi:hypothetical protein